MKFFGNNILARIKYLSLLLKTSYWFYHSNGLILTALRVWDITSSSSNACPMTFHVLPRLMPTSHSPSRIDFVSYLCFRRHLCFHPFSTLCTMHVSSIFIYFYFYLSVFLLNPSRLLCLNKYPYLSNHHHHHSLFSNIPGCAVVRPQVADW